MASTKSKVRVSGKRRSVAPSAPELRVGYKAAGRETMAAIEQELAAPGLTAADAPVIEISETPAGRETMAAIEQELSDQMRPHKPTLPYADGTANAPAPRQPIKAPAPKPKSAPPRPAAAVEIFELLTFIVRGGEVVNDLSSDARRRQFVERHLGHRLPGKSLAAVERIEATPWTAKGTMIVRVWCRA